MVWVHRGRGTIVGLPLTPPCIGAHRVNDACRYPVPLRQDGDTWAPTCSSCPRRERLVTVFQRGQSCEKFASPVSRRGPLDSPPSCEAPGTGPGHKTAVGLSHRYRVPLQWGAEPVWALVLAQGVLARLLLGTRHMLRNF